MGFMRVCGTEEEVEAELKKLKWTPCPHCKCVGHLIRHGRLQGFDDKHQRRRTVRAQRVFCSNRRRAQGCGRTFAIWWAEKIQRLFLTAESLWKFLQQAVESGSKWQAFRDLQCGLSDSAPYRIWKRFIARQSAIRTALSALCQPPPCDSEHPAALTLAHLQAAFPEHPSPIAAFQAKLQTRFL